MLINCQTHSRIQAGKYCWMYSELHITLDFYYLIKRACEGPRQAWTIISPWWCCRLLVAIAAHGQIGWMSICLSCEVLRSLMMSGLACSIVWMLIFFCRWGRWLNLPGLNPTRSKYKHLKKKDICVKRLSGAHMAAPRWMNATWEIKHMGFTAWKILINA